MENTSYKAYRIYVVSAGILSIAAAIVMTVFNYTFYDFELTLYEHKAPTFAICMIVISALIFFATCFLTLKTDLLPLRYPKKNGMLTGVMLLLCAGALCATVLLQLFAKEDDRLVQLFNANTQMMSTAAFLIRVSLVTAIIAAAYFVLAFVTDKVMPALSILTGIWALSYMMRVYYDMSTVVMDPIRMMSILSAACVAMFMIAETRIGMEKPAPRYYVFAGLVAAFVCFMSGFSKVMLFLLGKSALEVQTAYDLFELIFAIYAYSRLWAFMKYESFTETEYEASPILAEPEKKEDVIGEEEETLAPLELGFEEFSIDIDTPSKKAALSDKEEKSAKAPIVSQEFETVSQELEGTISQEPRRTVSQEPERTISQSDDSESANAPREKQ